MIDMRMADQDLIDGAGIKGCVLPVAQAEFLQPLEQSCIEQDTRSPDRQKMFRAGYGTSGAVKRESHAITHGILHPVHLPATCLFIESLTTVFPPARSGSIRWASVEGASG